MHCLLLFPGSDLGVETLRSQPAREMRRSTQGLGTPYETGQVQGRVIDLHAVVSRRYLTLTRAQINKSSGLSQLFMFTSDHSPQGRKLVERVTKLS